MHKNSTTYAGRYPALIELLRADGYRPRAFAQTMSAASLADVGVLVIVDAGGLEVPFASLSEQEVEAVVGWLRGGGSLLLIVDHEPYPLAAANLISALGVPTWPNGAATVAGVPGLRPGQNAINIVFWRAELFPGVQSALADLGLGAPAQANGVYEGADAVLAKHAITEGRRPEERVRRVVVFSGSAFQAPPGAQPLLTLPRRTTLRSAGAPETSIDGWLQGAVMEVGKGRLAIFADSGLFSGGTAGDNPQFVLNVMHWLSRALSSRGG
jgi:hypothetical protein